MPSGKKIAKIEPLVKAYNINTLEHTELVSSTSGEVFSKSAILSELFAHRDIFVHHEIIPPGKRSSSAHTHTLREEMVFILQGSATVHFGDQILQLQPGDFIGFKPNSTELHFIENKTVEEVRLLVICSNPTNDQVVFN